MFTIYNMYMYKNIYRYNMFFTSITIFFFFHHLFFFIVFFCVPYDVSFSRLSIFALHFGILLRLFWKCGRYILILLVKCMLWWFHVRINTYYIRYRSQHISDDGMYCMWLISMSIYNVFLYFYIFCVCLHIPRLVYVSVCTMQKMQEVLV